MRPASIPVTIIMLGGLLLILAGELYYAFIGPHPDASGSIQENVLNPLFWSDHPGISSVTVGLIFWIAGYILLRREDRREAKLTDPGRGQAGASPTLRERIWARRISIDSPVDDKS